MTDIEIEDLIRKAKCCGKPKFETELPETVVEGRFIIVDGQLYVGHEGVWLALGGSDLGTGTEGNVTLWGADNTLTEDPVLKWNTTDNVFVMDYGSWSYRFGVDVNENVVAGQDAGRFITNNFSNVFLGTEAGNESDTTSKAIGIGDSALYNGVNMDYSVAIGYTSMYNSNNLVSTIAIGEGSGVGSTFINRGVFLGPAGFNVNTSDDIILIGLGAGDTNTSIHRSILVGYRAGRGFSGNSISTDNIVIGTNISLPNAATRQLNIGGVLFGSGLYNTTTGNPLVTPVAGGKIGIGIVSPVTTLDVAGDLTVTSRTGTATSLSGFDASNKLVDLTLGSGITIDSGVLNVSASSTGLEAIDEGNGVGYRLIGRDPANHGNIGLNAIDLSYSPSPDSKGATGNYSFSVGFNTRSDGSSSTAIGSYTGAYGDYSVSSGYGGGVFAFAGFSHGYNNYVSHSHGVAFGSSSQSVALFSFVTGPGNTSNSMYETVVGAFATIATGQDASNYVTTDELYKIGNGVDAGNRSDALTIYKNAVQKIGGITGTALEAVTAQDGMLAYVNATSAVFTTIGFWARESGTWVKL